MLAGIILPSISLVMANIAVAFSGGEDKQPQPLVQTEEQLLEKMSSIGGYVVLIAFGIFAFSYAFYAFWQHLASNITNDLKKKYIAALLHQEIGYFENNKVE